MACSTNTGTGPVLPAELMDVVIDQLHSDHSTLGLCGMVCSEWLPRSRYHIFSTVQLWPWRASRFFELSRAQECTFTRHVKCIEVDNAQTSNDPHHPDHNEFLFHKIASSSSFSRFVHINTLRIRNVDWTLLRPSEQDCLRNDLAAFIKLKSLEFDDVMFHDSREMGRVITVFPSLRRLVANVQFSKYMEHAIASAEALTLPATLELLSLGTDDAIPVLLSTKLGESRISRLDLGSVKFWHLQYIDEALRNLGSQLRHLRIDFSANEGEWFNTNDLQQLSLVHQTELDSLHITGVSVFKSTAHCGLGRDIPALISRTSTISSLRHLTIYVIPESDSALDSFDWSALGQTFATRPSRHLNIEVAMPSTSIGIENEVKNYLFGKLKAFSRGGRLTVRVHNKARVCV